MMQEKSRNFVREDYELITDVATGPDSCNIPFYGSNSFKISGYFNLKNGLGLIKLFEDSNIYFVRAVEYEIGQDGSFLLAVEHFEDEMLSVYTYFLNPDDGMTMLKLYPDTNSLKRAFGYENGGDVFLRYCTNMGFRVDYTRYWYNNPIKASK